MPHKRSGTGAWATGRTVKSKGSEHRFVSGHEQGALVAGLLQQVPQACVESSSPELGKAARLELDRQSVTAITPPAGDLAVPLLHLLHYLIQKLRPAEAKHLITEQSSIEAGADVLLLDQDTFDSQPLKRLVGFPMSDAHAAADSTRQCAASPVVVRPRLGT